ncbi:MAG TPA: hypothetical protein VMU93_11720 [Caulobacteraceae bacterium]|nr:hypothetical protein [Caulobacteraceae bacterium]
MPKMPFSWAAETETQGRPLKGALLLALAVAVVAFCGALMLR